MIDDLFTFTQEELKDSWKKAKLLLRYKKFYDLVRAIDVEDPDLPNEEEYRTQRILEEGLTAVHIISRKLDDMLDTDSLLQAGRIDESRAREKKSFANLYSLFIGSSIIEKKLKEFLSNYDLSSARTADPARFTLENYDLPTDKLIEGIIDLENNFLTYKEGGKGRFVRHGVDLASMTKALFSGINSYCLRKKDEVDPDSHLGELIEKFEKTNLELFGVGINGFEKPTEHSKMTFNKVEYKDIVGNRNLVDYFRKAANYLLCFDPKSMSNPMDKIGSFANKVLLIGPPGTGKTTTIQAFLYDVQTRADEMGLGFEHISIGNDIKDKYFGESVKKLKAKFDKVKRGDKLYVISIEDIDAIFAARDDPQVSPAERDILHELMNTLEGIGSSDLGNCIIVSSSNLTSSDGGGSPIDKALLGRVAEEQIEVLGPETPEDYSNLLKIKLKKGISNGYISVDRWDDLGQMCYEAKVSGRDIKNITKSLLSDAAPTEFPLAILKIADPDDKANELLKHYRKMDQESLTGRIKKYCETQKKNDESVETQRLERRKQQIINEIKAEGMARDYLASQPIKNATDDAAYEMLCGKIYEQIISSEGLKQKIDDTIAAVLGEILKGSTNGR